MTRNDIEQAVYRRTNKNTSSVNSDVQTRVRHFINRRYRKLLGMPGAAFLLDDTATFASVADQYRYALAHIDEVKRMWETTNDLRLRPMSLDEYRRRAPDPTVVTGVPTHYAFVGYQPVAKQPADASEIFVKSSSASDTTQTCYVELDITGGYPRTLSVTLTGTTAVTLAAAVTTGERIRKFYLSATAVGSVTLHEDSGSGTELARIGIGQTSQRYWVFHLYPTPADALTYSCDVVLPVTDLAQNTDEPRMPEKFHDLLELGAAMDEYGKTDDSRYAVMADEYERQMSDWIYFLAKQAAARSEKHERHSTLGAMFPAGT